MFTGLVETIGTVIDLQDETTDAHTYRRMRITIPRMMKGIHIGDSISIDGACQTAVRYNKWKGWADFEAFHVTLHKTTLGMFTIGSKVNMERALLVGQRIGGHFVLGHVEAKTTIADFKPAGQGWTLCVNVPHRLMQYITREGSIVINGMSLTIADVDDVHGIVTCNIIDHTYRHTTLQWKSGGDSVNIECDMMAKYAVDATMRYHHGNKPTLKRTKTRLK